MASLTEPWVELARKDMAAGVKEVPGSAGHPRILEMYDNAGLAHGTDDDQSWCGCALGTWLKEADYPVPANFYGAKQFETYGRKLDTFQPGAICVFYRTKLRERDWRRHVTIGIEETATHIKCLGGNQGDAVSIRSFPKRDLAAIRWPVKATVRDLRQAGSSEIKSSDTLVKWGAATVLTAAGGKAGEVAMPPTPPNPTVESLQELSTLSGLMKAIMEGSHALLAVFTRNVWISTIIVGCIMLFVAARLRKVRVERAERGDPLSPQAG